jgi:hypothetical protein
MQPTGRCVSSDASESVTATKNAEKQRRYRLRKQQQDFEQSGSATLYTACRECGRPIKPSFFRPFCRGGECRSSFFAKIQVLNVCYLDSVSKWVSEKVLAVTHAG